jgi:LacI family transcriptional regulator
MARNGPANLRAIAAETGLALATVSRILRGRDQCSEGTRQRVREVAERLRYRPNLLVRGLQTGRTKTGGVLMQVREFTARILEGVHDELVGADHMPIVLWPRIVYDTKEKTNDLEQLHRLIDPHDTAKLCQAREI